MTIKFHPIKSNGQERKTPLHAITYADLDKLQGDYGVKGRYFVDNVEVPQQDILDSISADKIARQKELSEIALAQYQKDLAARKEKVGTLTVEEQNLYWLLYGNLEATFCPAYYTEEEDTVELTFKGIPLDKITCKKPRG